MYIRETNQIEQRSFTPAACPIVTFLRRPPIYGCTNKIIINFPNGCFPVNENNPLNSPIFYDP
jgi:hypothetical protein